MANYAMCGRGQFRHAQVRLVARVSGCREMRISPMKERSGLAGHCYASCLMAPDERQYPQERAAVRASWRYRPPRRVATSTSRAFVSDRLGPSLGAVPSTSV